MALPATMRCYLVTKDAPSGAQGAFHTRPTSELPPGDVLVPRGLVVAQLQRRARRDWPSGRGAYFSARARHRRGRHHC